jgi:hypothetical protein
MQPAKRCRETARYTERGLSSVQIFIKFRVVGNEAIRVVDRMAAPSHLHKEFAPFTGKT